jgi:serine/threonine protein kinase
MELDELLPVCLASAASSPPAPCLHALHAAAQAGIFRDAEASCVAALAPCWAALLRAALAPSAPALCVRLLLESFAAVVDSAEWGAAVRAAVGAAPSVCRELCARAVACAQGAWGDAQRGVFGTALSAARAADVAQPRGGVLGGGPSAAAPAPTPAPVTAPPPPRRGPLRAPFDELRALRGLLAWLWLHFPQHRADAERAVERLLRGVGREVAPEGGAAVCAALQLVGAVCAGGGGGGGGGSSGGGSLFSARTVAEAARLLELLVPLLSAQGGAGGAGTVLSLYFDPLSALLRGVACAHENALLPSAVDAIASALTAALSESAARAELLLTLLRSLAGAWAAAWAAARRGSSGAAPPALAPKLLQGLVLPLVADENSRLAQAALAFFSDSAFCAWCAAGSGKEQPELLACVRALLRNGRRALHWNPTVNKHTHAALSALRSAARAEGCEALFLSAAEALCGGGARAPEPMLDAPSAAPAAGRVEGPQPHPPPPLALGAGRGPLQPRTAPGGVGVGGGGGWHPSSGAPPPLTITGVAPWAAAVGGSSGHANRVARAAARAVERVAAANAAAHAVATAPTASAAVGGGSSPLEDFLSSLLPPAPAPPPPLTPGVVRLPPQLLPEPVRLPALAFHDLVFGRELGRGSFSTVRAAQHIQRGPGAPPSAQWPWYAVKELTAATLRSAAYRPAARREAAVLGALRHPATARLASAFQWRGGVYFVLEHACGGDLHELLAASGPLPEDTARFLMGEVAAALLHVHALGFAFGDCKPENVVLVAPPADGGDETWAGAGGLHAKLADFAACRPINAAGAGVLAEGKGVLRTLRSGDWRDGAGKGGGGAATAAAAPAAAGVKGEGGVEENGEESEEDGEVDERIEGTLEYLAPELQGGASLPTVASDAYAFGVTLFQALCGGRMPDTDALWPPGGGGGQGVRWAGAGAVEGFPPDFPVVAAPLVRALLHPDPAQRMGGGPRGFTEIVEHPWFAALGCRMDELYLAKGPADPRNREERDGEQRANPQWARRHASVMWAPSLQAARALRVGGEEGGDRAAADARTAAQLQLGELMALAALPPLPSDQF